MRWLLVLLLCVPLLLWGGVRIYKDVTFGIDVTQRLKRAADANTVELAAKELAVVIANLEANNLTNGYTSVLYRTPDEDIAFWYTNLKDSLTELRLVRPDATQLEKSNVLMKLRETLLDQGKESVHVTVPDGMSIYPGNVAYAVWGWFGLLLFCASCVYGIYLVNETY